MKEDRVERMFVGLMRGMSDLEHHLQELKKTPYYRQQVKRKANMLERELKIVRDEFFESKGMIEEDLSKLENSIKKDALFQASVVSTMTDEEKEMTSIYLEKLRENKDTESVDLDKESKTKDIDGEYSVVKVVVLEKEATSIIAKNFDLSKDNDVEKFKQECFSKAKKLAGRGWEYSAHSMGNDKRLRVSFAKKEKDDKKK